MPRLTGLKTKQKSMTELVVCFFFLTLKKSSFDIGDFYAYVQHAVLGPKKLLHSHVNSRLIDW